MAGRARCGNQACIALVVALLTRIASIRWVCKILTYGLRRRKPSNQCFPMPVAKPPARRIRLAKVRICTCVGPTPRASYIRIQSASRLSCTGDNFCWNVCAVVLACRPASRCRKVVRGTPQSRAARATGTPDLTAFNALVSVSSV
jgi:hypothetical protein